jgi:hypothetical protein
MTGGAVALALILGGLGTEAAAASTHSVDHAGTGQRVGSDHARASQQLASSDTTSPPRPWMY